MPKTRSAPHHKPWRDQIEVHNAAMLFPRLSEAEQKELSDDIATNGLRVPVTLWRANTKSPLQLLDGIGRLDAIEAKGLFNLDSLRPAPQKLTAGDPYLIALSLNSRRRHLTHEQRDKVLDRIIKARPDLSSRFIGKLTGRDHKTVERHRQVQGSTGESPQLGTRVGADGRRRKRPVRKSRESKPESPLSPTGGLGDGRPPIDVLVTSEGATVPAPGNADNPATSNTGEAATASNGHDRANGHDPAADSHVQRCAELDRIAEQPEPANVANETPSSPASNGSLEAPIPEPSDPLDSTSQPPAPDSEMTDAKMAIELSELRQTFVERVQAWDQAVSGGEFKSAYELWNDDRDGVLELADRIHKNWMREPPRA